MDELKACPFCGTGVVSIEYDGLYRWVECGNMDCNAAGKVFAFLTDVGNADHIVANNWNTRPIEDALNARIAELEKRTAGLHYANAVCMEMKHELVRRDEIIARLKEDAERLATRAVYWDDYGNEYECIHLECSGHSENILFDHAPDCPITLHRALMKELE